MSEQMQDMVQDYRSSNIKSMTRNEIFSFLQDEIGFSTVTIKAAEKLYDDVKEDINYKNREEIIGACVRIKSVDKGEPVRINKICETLDIESRAISKVCKSIKTDKDLKILPDPGDYAAFLLKRLGISSTSKEKIVRKKINETEDADNLIGKPATSVGMAAVCMETDLTMKEVAEEVSTSPATIKANKEQIEIAVGE